LAQLADDFLEAYQRFEDLTRVVGRMDDEHMDRPVPQPLRIQPADFELGRKPWQTTDEFWRRPCDVDKWRRLESWEMVTKTDDEVVMRKSEPPAELRARANEIVTTFDQWEAQSRKPKGYAKACREAKAACNRAEELMDKISKWPVNSVGDLQIKAMVAARDGYEFSDDVLKSMAEDLLAVVPSFVPLRRASDQA
jgi:hypothetical protein